MHERTSQLVRVVAQMDIGALYSLDAPKLFIADGISPGESSTESKQFPWRSSTRKSAN
jgi:hypothetical protein